MKYYILFLSPGTNAPIYAYTVCKFPATLVPPRGLVLGKYSFSKRLPGPDPIGIRPDQVGIRVSWSELFTSKGLPLRDPVRIVKAFNKLAADGWVVDREAFTAAYSNRFFQKRQEVIPNGD